MYVVPRLSGGKKGTTSISKTFQSLFSTPKLFDFAKNTRVMEKG